MQIVIELDDKTYQRNVDHDLLTVADLNKFIVAIGRGTPLPKGHGDLIDRDALECTYVEEVGCEGWMHCVVRSLVVKEAQVIIPAEEVSE